jgi:hypothetical protein
MFRVFFFVLFFPPTVMILLLVQTAPTDLTRYFLAGYLIATVPAALLALTDQIMERASGVARATGCGLVGLALSPIAMWFLSAGDIKLTAQAACCGGIVAFLCAVAFAQLDCAPAPRREDDGSTVNTAASTPPDPSPQPAT